MVTLIFYEGLSENHGRVVDGWRQSSHNINSGILPLVEASNKTLNGEHFSCYSVQDHSTSTQAYLQKELIFRDSLDGFNKISRNRQTVTIASLKILQEIN